VDVWKSGGASDKGERQTLGASDKSVPPDGMEHTVKLPIKEAGLYRIDINDGNDRTLVKWPSGQSMTVQSSADSPMTGSYQLWRGYFYVPKGTTTIGVFGGNGGEVRDSQGRRLFWLNGREPNYYSFPVPTDEDGKIWEVRHIRGALRLLTVPPYFAATPQELLLPKKVVEKDAKR